MSDPRDGADRMRASRDGRLPTLSVVLVALGDDVSLTEALSALAPQTAAEDVELILPVDARLRRSLDGVPRRLVARARLVDVARRDAAPPVLRAAGVRAAHGDVVAVIEDHTIPVADWCRRLREAHRAPHAAVGGSVEKALPDGALGWAMFLLDYGRYMPPLATGPSTYLTSCNVGYKRVALERIAHAWPDELRETEVHGALLARGETLWLDPALVVLQRRRVGFARAAREWFAYGREFGAARARTERVPRSLARVVAAPLLPPLLARRALTHLHRRKAPTPTTTWRILPALLALAGAWAAGEAAGALAAMRPGERDVLTLAATANDGVEELAP